MDDDLKIFVLDSKHALVIGFDGSELINRYPLILTGFNTRRRWNPVVEKTDKTTSVYDFHFGGIYPVASHESESLKPRLVAARNRRREMKTYSTSCGFYCDFLSNQMQPNFISKPKEKKRVKKKKRKKRKGTLLAVK